MIFWISLEFVGVPLVIFGLAFLPVLQVPPVLPVLPVLASSDSPSLPRLLCFAFPASGLQSQGCEKNFLTHGTFFNPRNFFRHCLLQNSHFRTCSKFGFWQILGPTNVFAGFRAPRLLRIIPGIRKQFSTRLYNNVTHYIPDFAEQWSEVGGIMFFCIKCMISYNFPMISVDFPVTCFDFQ